MIGGLSNYWRLHVHVVVFFFWPVAQPWTIYFLLHLLILMKAARLTLCKFVLLANRCAKYVCICCYKVKFGVTGGVLSMCVYVCMCMYLLLMPLQSECSLFHWVAILVPLLSNLQNAKVIVFVYMCACACMCVCMYNALYPLNGHLGIYSLWCFWLGVKIEGGCHTHV